jgi:hypothetical protein
MTEKKRSIRIEHGWIRCSCSDKTPDHASDKERAQSVKFELFVSSDSHKWAVCQNCSYEHKLSFIFNEMNDYTAD